MVVTPHIQICVYPLLLQIWIVVDISEKNFRVLYPDPHKFDREGDGIGCET